MCAKFLCKKCTFNSTFILSINQRSILHQLQPHFICNFIANEKLLNNYLTLIKGQLISKYLFGVFNTFKNKQKQIDLRYRSIEGEFFRSFFGGRIEDTEKTFQN